MYGVFGIVCVFWVREIVRRSDRLAQASQTRLGESCRVRIVFCMSYSLRRNVKVLGDPLFRSGKTFLPKRDYEDVRLCFRMPRTGEGIRVLGDKVSRLGERFSLKRDLL